MTGRQYVIHVRAARWAGPGTAPLLHAIEYGPVGYKTANQYTRNKLRQEAAQRFKERFGKSPDEFRFFAREVTQTITDDDRALAGALLEQERAMSECDADSECSSGAVCVQCMPREVA